MKVFKMVRFAWPKFHAILEHPVGEFTLDIYVPDVNLDIEIQGPQHYRKKTAKREEKLRSYGIENFLYIPVSDVKNTQELFLTLKKALIKEEGEEGIKRDHGCCSQSQPALDTEQV